jgi:hypothetical protein
VNGIPRGRRAARPIRITLARELGTDIDGAWWPHSSAMAAELPDLIGALHATLGEVEAIRINWAPTEGQLDLETIAHGARMQLPGEKHRRPRLMVVAGATDRVKLLVVPSLTSQALGSMVLRAAAGLPTSGGTGDGRLFETACVVMRLARAESETWCGSLTW